MDNQAILNLLITYRYLILLPLAIIEGPIVSLIAGFMVYLGYFNFGYAYGVLLLGDFIPDLTYYYIGRLGNKKQLMEKYGQRFNFISDNFKIIEKLWRDHAGKTMFLSKLAYGLSTPFLISAGLAKVPLKRFVTCAFPITMFQYAVIMTLGYYLGHSYQFAENYLELAGIIFAAALVLFIAAYVIISKYARREIIILEKEEEQK